MKHLFLLVILVSFINCNPLSGQVEESITLSKDFKKYWYGGEAELNRYELEQQRYGEVHTGEAVLIFVTEDFLSDKQVKFEGGKRNDTVEPIIKLNFTKKFFTGLYPYSLMSSIFTPVDHKKQTFKVSTSSQEWCGHTFTQLNLKKGNYEGKLFSYFMNEGDQNFKLNNALLEDEIWNKIRLEPSSLPLGKIKIIPGTLFLRLKHKEYQIEEANASLTTSSDDASNKRLKTYKVEYTSLNRVLEITFEESFPHRIVSWSEKYKSGLGGNSKEVSTVATLTHQIKSDYWSKNSNLDKSLREKLGLNMSNY